jgi:hypothetical protein
MMAETTQGTLYYGDNLDILRRHVTDESVDLVYLDPPFKSNQDYNVLFAEQNGSRSSAQIKVFEDTWHWDQDEEFRLFTTLPADPPALRPYFRFLLATGARAGEACTLTWRAISEADGVAELPETKAGQKQYLTLSTEAMTILRELPRVGSLAFCWPDGRPFTVDYTTHALRRATVAAGIPDLRQHDLRHAFAIRRLRGGANLVAVSALLRHASTRMSERYLHVTRSDLRAAVEAGSSLSTRSAAGKDVDALLRSAGVVSVPQTPRYTTDRSSP